MGISKEALEKRRLRNREYMRRRRKDGTLEKRHRIMLDADTFEKLCELRESLGLKSIPATIRALISMD